MFMDAGISIQTQAGTAASAAKSWSEERSEAGAQPGNDEVKLGKGPHQIGKTGLPLTLSRTHDERRKKVFGADVGDTSHRTLFRKDLECPLKVNSILPNLKKLPEVVVVASAVSRP